MRLKNSNSFWILTILVIYLGINILIADVLSLFGEEYTSFHMWFILLFVGQLILIILAISPLGEMILRFLFGARKIVKQQDKDYLDPIFRSVYRNVLENKKRTSKRIKLYIDRSMGISAYAVGNNTIVVSRGTIDSLSPDELKGVIAHELGHLYNGDTIVNITLLVGNIYLCVIFMIIKIIKIILGACDIITGEDKLYSNIGKFLIWICGMVAVPAVLIIRIAVYVLQRENEYKSDEFSHEIGQGSNLISALYKLDKLDFSDGDTKMIERLLTSHPRTDKRIEKLESMQKK